MRTILNTRWVLAIIVVTVLLSVSVFSLSAKENESKIHNLVGTWKSDKYTVAYPNGTNTASSHG